MIQLPVTCQNKLYAYQYLLTYKTTSSARLKHNPTYNITKHSKMKIMVLFSLESVFGFGYTSSKAVSKTSQQSVDVRSRSVAATVASNRIYANLQLLGERTDTRL